MHAYAVLKPVAHLGQGQDRKSPSQVIMDHAVKSAQWQLRNQIIQIDGSYGNQNLVCNVDGKEGIKNYKFMAVKENCNFLW